METKYTEIQKLWIVGCSWNVSKDIITFSVGLNFAKENVPVLFSFNKHCINLLIFTCNYIRIIDILFSLFISIATYKEY